MVHSKSKRKHLLSLSREHYLMCCLTHLVIDYLVWLKKWKRESHVLFLHCSLFCTILPEKSIYAFSMVHRDRGRQKGILLTCGKKLKNKLSFLPQEFSVCFSSFISMTGELSVSSFTEPLERNKMVKSGNSCDMRSFLTSANQKSFQWCWVYLWDENVCGWSRKRRLSF